MRQRTCDEQDDDDDCDLITFTFLHFLIKDVLREYNAPRVSFPHYGEEIDALKGDIGDRTMGNWSDGKNWFFEISKVWNVNICRVKNLRKASTSIKRYLSSKYSAYSQRHFTPEIGKEKVGQFGVSSGSESYSGCNCMNDLIDKGRVVK
ncbi:restriction endonuclease, type II-like superfamily protein [Artemisia annua]|uniref:Restriction endonuclease, type II-like superfamily protein n=1 Tax=Artemisia annua TaxID=35608 RepID=A0A2U1PYT1_ARTAN|nr:restriction endonuclease, type II-like superfamily protein [Artemisia annua]